MAYYPKSQIKTNLKTSGDEFILSSTREKYIGFYYEVSNGDKFAGKTPENGSNILLLPIPTDQEPESADIEEQSVLISPPIIAINDYANYPQVNKRFLPRYAPTIPTQKDYDLGEYQRYFAKKNNQNIYLEINKETCDQLKDKDPNIAFDLYTAISLSWNLSGEQDQTYLINKNTVILVENREKWYGFEIWFKDDFLKYHQNPDIQSDLFTDGTEFINRRTKLAYKGPYHIHPDKGPMVGAKHIQRKHDFLDPIQPTQDLTVDPEPTPPPLSTPTYSSGGSSASTGGGGSSGGGGGY